jgi:hypothetical protein
MTDAEQISYFTEVLKRLDALRAQAPKDSIRSRLVREASEPIGNLVGYLMVGTRKRSFRKVRKK